MAQLQSTSITGSLIVTQGITGSFSGSITNAVSASYAATASYALNAGDSIWTGSSGNIYYSGGNVGIGITNPGYRLEVNGGTGAASGNIARFTLGGAGGGTRGLTMYSDGSQLKLQVTDNVGNYGTWAYLNLNPDGGNVGIGITNPGAELHIQGTSTEQVLISYDSTRRMIMGRTTGYGWISPYTNGVSYDNLVLVRDGGNVGIGVTNPDQPLAFTDSLGTKIQFNGINGNGYQIGLASAVAGGDAMFKFTAGEIGAGEFGFYNTTNLRMLINASGNVGIGTSSPQGQLSLNNQIATSTPLTYSTVQQNVLNGYYTFSESPNLYMRYFDIACIGDGDGTNGGGNIRFLTNPIANDIAVERMRITHAGNVGIGTASPSQKFVVSNGSAEVFKVYSTGEVIVGTNYIYAAASGNSFYSEAAANFRGGIRNDVGAYLQIDGGSSGNTYFNGNVGIGTTTPSHNLHLYGAGDRLIKIENTGTYLMYAGLISNEGYIGSTNATPLGFYTNNVNRLYINTSGNIGIGTTSPSYRLDVNGVTRFQNVVRFVNNAWNLSDDGFNRFYFAGSGRTYFGSGGGYEWRSDGDVTLAVLTNGGNLVLKGTNPFTTGGTATLSVVGDIISLGASDSDLAYFRRLGTGQFQWQTYNSGNSGEIHLQPYGGNVGIGTTTPRTNLHVWNPSTGNAVEVARFTSAYAGTGDGPLIRFTNYLSYATNPNAGEYNLAGIRAYDFASSWGGALQFLTSVTTGGGGALVAAMTINQTQQVGIGTTSPSALLHVSQPSADTVLRIGNNSNYDQYIYFNGGNDWSMGMDYSNSNAFVLSNYSTLGTNDRLVVTTGGNVGIGTSSPTATLQINGAGGDTAPTLRLISAASDTFNWASSTQHANLTAGETSIHLIGKANSQYNQAYFGYRHVSDGSSSNMVTIGMYASDYLLNILGNGNVGIGTTSPAYKLDVIGTQKIGSTAISQGLLNIVSTTTGTSDIFFSDDTDNRGVVRYDHTSDFMSLWSAGSERMRITSAGNVGIGTTSPAGKLSISTPNSYDGTILQLQSRDEPTAYNLKIDEIVTSGVVRWSFGMTNSSAYNNVLVFDRGNIGIGTTTPAVTLQVDASGGGLIRATRTSAGSGYIQMEADGTNGTLTANNILYLNAGGSTKMTVLSGGNVGIGTTSPIAKLNIASDGNTQFTITRTNASNSQQFNINVESDSQTSISYDSNSPLVIGTSTNPGTQAGFTERMRITSGGNVGIGTTAPSVALHIARTAAVSPSIRLHTTDSTTNGSIQWTNSGNSVLAFIGSNSNISDGSGNLEFATGGTTTRMVINSAGNVGIGVTNPGATLVVGTQSSGTAGSGVAQDNSIIARFGASNTAGRVTGITIANTAAATVGNNATLSFIVASNYSATGLISSILQNTGTAATDMAFSVYNATDNFERMRITAGGNVGIGITNPTDKLTVEGNISIFSSYKIYNGSAADSAGISFPSNVVRIDGFSGITFNSSTTNIGSQTERMRITNDGNVGIGTTSPGAKLNIVESTSGYDQVAIFTGTGQYGSSIHLNATGTAGSNWRILSTANGSTPGGGHFGLYNDAAGLYRLVINPSGNVGIGTTNPSNGKLQVNGRIYTVGTAGTANAIFQGGQLEFYKDATPTYAASIGLSGPSSGGTNDIVFETYGGTWSERMRIATGGNVGIGTTSPASRLEVGNFLDAFTNSITVSGRYEYVPQFTFKLGQSGTNYDWIGGVISCGDDGNYNGIINFKTANAGRDTPTTKMVIKANGNVGIGTTSPAFPLHVVRSSGDSVIVVDSGAAYNSQFRFQEAGGLTAAITFVSSDDSLRFYNGGDRFTILSNGSVGIGTTSPTQALTIQKSGYPIIDFYDGATGRGDIGYNTGTTSFNVSAYGAIPMVFYVNSTERMRISSAGDLLIKGTYNPHTITNRGNITLNGTSGNIIAFTDNTNQNGYILHQAGELNIFNQLNNILSLGTNGTERMRITSGGNVGIGVTAPAAKLQVSGSSNVLNVRGSGSAATSSIFSVDGNNGRLFEVSDDLSNSLFSVNTIAGLPVIEAFADYTVTMGTYGAYTLQVTGSRVGVGTSSPGYPLHVSGSVSGISIYATNDIAAFSDQSVKTDLQVIDSAVDRIKQINGYTYVRVDDLSNTRRAGVIAQEVQKVLPEVVSENQDGTLNVAYSNMIALLIEGMKEQQSQIDKLREDLEDLRYEL